MLEPWNWAKENLDSLIGQAESIRLDFKESKLFSQSRERIAENLSREVSAFANTEGGVIVVGIAERRDGKSRIADHIDEGIDPHLWTPERLQQLIESNTSPYLTGLRVRPILLDSVKSRSAYVIYVPQGNTAYQASDHRYYGRSEYESKSLPDYEIRLRMFRGKTPSAVVRVTDCSTRDLLVPHKDLKQTVHGQHENFLDELSKPDQNQQIALRRHDFSLVVDNTGEVNITEFKVQLDFPAENYFKLNSYSRTVKEGWLQSGFPYSMPQQGATPMRVNIYPQDTYYFISYALFLRAHERLRDRNLIFQWTLYLSNTLPIHGQISIAEEFERMDL